MPETGKVAAHTHTHYIHSVRRLFRVCLPRYTFLPGRADDPFTEGVGFIALYCTCLAFCAFINGPRTYREFPLARALSLS